MASAVSANKVKFFNSIILFSSCTENAITLPKLNRPESSIEMLINFVAHSLVIYTYLFSNAKVIDNDGH